MVDRVAPRRRWSAWLVALLGLAGAYHGATLYAMAASFAAARPEQLAYWRRAAVGYLALVGVSLLLVAGAAVALLRGWARPPEDRDRAV